MTSALRAPELSAILRIDSCWITVRVSSAGPLEDFDHAPALGLRQRPRLHDAHRIPRLGALVVVGRDLLGADHLLAVEAVREAAHQRNGDRLRHLVAHHDPRAHRAPPAPPPPPPPPPPPSPPPPSRPSAPRSLPRHR